MIFQLFERVRATRDIYYDNIDEPVVLKGDEGVWHGEAVLFDKNRFAETAINPPEHIYIYWGDYCAKTIVEEDIEGLGVIDLEAKEEDRQVAIADQKEIDEYAKNCGCHICRDTRHNLICDHSHAEESEPQ